MEIWHTIEMPFVPRIGDDINIGHEKYSHLERKIEGDQHLREKYKRWIYAGGRCSFDDAMTVIELVYRESSKEIHIELGEDVNEKRSREY